VRQRRIFASLVIGALSGVLGSGSVLAAMSDIRPVTEATIAAPQLPAESRGWFLPDLSGPTRLAQDSSASNLTEAQQDQVDDLIIKAQEQIDAQNYGEAVNFYEQAARIDRRNARLFSGIGYLQIQQGQLWRSR
jgi:hypothetical protein